MKKSLLDMRPVYVVGIGMDRYQPLTDRSYVELGLGAIRGALEDANIDWPLVESAYVGNALLGMAPGRAMLKYLGTTGIPVAQVENASASGSTAFRQACLDVASGLTDVTLAIGVDKPAAMGSAKKPGNRDLIGRSLPPVVHFAMLADRYRRQYDISREELAAVAVKNHRNGSMNPFAHRQKERSLAEILTPPFIAGDLTRLQCCPVGEGAAAVIVASEDALERLALDESRTPRIIASVSRSEEVYDEDADSDTELTRSSIKLACDEAELASDNLDVIELHDAFSIEEVLYIEAMGLSQPGEGARDINRGDFNIGGRCAVSPSGGLLSMGHPIGPTGVGQICEITRQLRGEAGPRQQPNARIGLAHMVGVGAVCLVHILSNDHLAV